MRALRLILLAAAPGETVLHALAAQLPASGEAPEWITLFPKIGSIETRDGRAFHIDPATLIAAFERDGLQLPVDVNHATDLAGVVGARSDAIGWITELKAEAGSLLGKVDWLAEGRELLAARKYRYVSPSFLAEAGTRKATWLRAASLVTAPALANQPALASALKHHASPTTEEHLMSTTKPGDLAELAKLLGLAEDADLAAITAKVRGLLTTNLSAAPDPAAFVPIKEFEMLNAEFHRVNQGIALQAAQQLVEDQIRQGRMLPFLRGWATELCTVNKPAFDGFIARTGPEVNKLMSPSPLEGRRVSDLDEADLTTAERSVAAVLGHSPAELATQRRSPSP